MATPINVQKTGDRLTGQDMSRYLEEYYEKFLAPRNIVRFNTEVISLKRGPKDQGWTLIVNDVKTGTAETLFFPKVVLCTGVSIIG